MRKVWNNVLEEEEIVWCEAGRVGEKKVGSFFSRLNFNHPVFQDPFLHSLLSLFFSCFLMFSHLFIYFNFFSLFPYIPRFFLVLLSFSSTFNLSHSFSLFFLNFLSISPFSSIFVLLFSLFLVSYLLYYVS